MINPETKTEQKKIIVAGCGFSGVYVGRNLQEFTKKGFAELTIINETNHFLFTPLLHEVATGGLSPGNVAEPIREIFNNRHINFIQTKIKKVDSQKKEIETTSGKIAYDYLVLATGAKTNFYETEGAEKFSLTLKNLDDSIKIRNKIIDNFERASINEDPEARKNILSFVVVGGGATGVELTAEIAELCQDTLKKYYKKTKIEGDEIKITLVSSSKELLMQLSEKSRKKAETVLRNKGVQLILGATVKKVDENGVNLENGQMISGKTVLWVAGVTPNLPQLPLEIKRHQSGRIFVNKFLEAEGVKDIFVLGDIATLIPENNDQKPTSPTPMLAQVAVQEAKIVATNIIAKINNAPLNKFELKLKGSMVSLGQWMAIGEIFGVKISGKLTWWLWRTVYLFKFISWRKRFKIALEWTIGLFSKRDITRLS